MGKKADEDTILIEARIKMHLAKDLLRWVMNPQTNSIVDPREMEDVLKKLHEWENALFNQIRDKKTKHWGKS